MATTSSSLLARSGAGGLVLGGVAWLALGFGAAFPNTPLGSQLAAYAPVLGVAALLLFGVGMVGLHALQRGRYGHLGRAGFYAVLVGIALVLFAGTVLSGGEGSAQQPVVAAGGLALLMGVVLYGLASLRARVLPWWDGALLVAFVPIAAACGAAGSGMMVIMWWGAISLELGCALWARGGGGGGGEAAADSRVSRSPAYPSSSPTPRADGRGLSDSHPREEEEPPVMGRRRYRRRRRDERMGRLRGALGFGRAVMVVAPIVVVVVLVLILLRLSGTY